MEKNRTSPNDITPFRKDFAINARVGFNTAGQYKIFLAIVSQINPTDTSIPMSGILTIQQIEALTKEAGYKGAGNIHDRVKERIEKMMERNYIKFTNEGKGLPSYGPVFDRLRPVEVDGIRYYKWRIQEHMRSFVIGFVKGVVKISPPRGMKSGYSTRFLMLAVIHHNKHKRSPTIKNGITKLISSIVELKEILGLEGKYTVFKNFRKRIIEVIAAEVNESKLLYIPQYRFIRTGRKITAIAFCFQDAALEQLQADHKNTKEAVPKSTNKYQLAAPPQSRSEKRGGGIKGIGDLLGKAIPKQEAKEIPPFEYEKWQQENETEYKELIAEKWKKFEELLGDVEMEEQKKKDTLDKMIFNEAAYRYKQRFLQD